MTTLALSMIVRDAAKFLPQCLESVRGLVDEIVIADTGSIDATQEIARSFGTQVIQIPWHNDFAQARNACLEKVQSSWVLSLDADEVLEPECGEKLRRLTTDSSVAGFQVTIRNFVLSLQDRLWDKPAVPNDSPLPAGKKFPAYADHQNVRLFRNEKSIRFSGRVHESVGPSLLQHKRRLSTADFLIYHFGLALAEEERAAKNIFYRELGRQKVREMPNDAQAHLELGLVELDNFANLEEASRLFSRACELNPRLATAWFFAGIANFRQQRFPEALRCLLYAQKLGPGSTLLAETLGDTHYNLGDFRQAAASYQSALTFDPDNPSLTSKVGLALVRAGDSAAGLGCLQNALRSRPAATELYDRKMLALLSLGKIADAAQTLETKLTQIPCPTAPDYLRAASLWSKAGNTTRAFQIVESGLNAYPEDKSLLMARGELSSQPFLQTLSSLPSTP